MNDKNPKELVLNPQTIRTLGPKADDSMRDNLVQTVTDDCTVNVPIHTDDCTVNT